MRAGKRKRDASSCESGRDEAITEARKGENRCVRKGRQQEAKAESCKCEVQAEYEKAKRGRKPERLKGLKEKAAVGRKSRLEETVQRTEN